MESFKAYGIETTQYDLGSISATFPGGEPVEFISVSTHDGGQIATGFRQPYVRKEGNTLIVDKLQLMPVMQILLEVDAALGGKPDPKYAKKITDFQGELIGAARTCLTTKGADELKAKYGVTKTELDFIESLQERLGKANSLE